jgi:hypothetical protein
MIGEPERRMLDEESDIVRRPVSSELASPTSGRARVPTWQRVEG